MNTPQHIQTALPIYRVDAFTDQPFKGNPAAVCLLSEPVEDSVMQLIAMEMNLAETAFLLPMYGNDYKQVNMFSLRWFMASKAESPMCGHATLAAAHVLFEQVGSEHTALTFETRSGRLSAVKTADGVAMDFPYEVPVQAVPPAELLAALGLREYVNAVHSKGRATMLIEVADEAALHSIKPAFETLKSLRFPEQEVKKLAVTTRGNGKYDFVSRCFCPWIGINEDSVSAATHTLLAPYWSQIVGKTELLAYQASKRGGAIWLKMKENNRIDVVGDSVVTMKGTVCVNDCTFVHED